MTTQKNETKKQGERPTHTLYASSTQHGKEVNVKFAAMWNHPEKGYMSVSLEGMELIENPKKGLEEPPFLLLINANHFGQPMPMKIGSFSKTDTKGCYVANKINLVVFENKPRETEQTPKAKVNGQPRP